jgi:hypothetical protein
MCQHIRYRHPIGAKKTKVQPGRRRKYERPPASGNLRQLVPPTLEAPPGDDYGMLKAFFVLDIESMEIEYVEKDVIVEDMDR